jgi:hypothetical protein
MVANLKSLYIPLDPLPKVDASWLDKLTGSIGDAMDQRSDTALARQALGVDTPQQPSQGFFGRLLGSGRQQPQRPVSALSPTSAVPAPSAGSASLGTPNDIQKQFISTAQQGGLTNPYGLAALAATGRAESSFDPSKVNAAWPDPSQSGQAGTAGGILSWRNERLANLRNFAQAQGEDPSNISPATQAKFFLQEDPTLITRLNAAKSPQEAASLMAGAWKFRGYDQPGGEAARRQAMTQNFYSTQFSGDQNPATASTPSLSAPASNPTRTNAAPVGQVQVASLDPSISLLRPGTVGQTQANNQTPAAAFDPATATPEQLLAALGNSDGVDPNRFASGPVAQGREGLATALSAQGDGTGQPKPSQTPYVDPMVTTATQQGDQQPPAQPPGFRGVAGNLAGAQSMQRQQPQGSSVLAPAVTPIAPRTVNPAVLAQMLGNPRMRDIGLALWKQNAGQATSEPWQFVQLGDGTLARANQQTGEVQAVGQFAKPKAALQNVPKGGALYDEATGQWITPPEGAGGSNQDNYFGNVIKGYDNQGNPIYLQPGKDGTVNQLKTPDGFHAENRLEKVDLGTSWLIKDTTTGETQMVPKDVQGEAFQKKVGTDTGEQQAGKVAAGSSLGNTLSGLDRLADTVDSISSDPGLGKVTGWESKFPSFPGGEAAGVQARLNTLKSQVGFNVLQAMREASKTGGALGAVSDRENELLQNNLAALDQAQSLGDFKKQLGKIKEYVTGAKQRLSGAYKQMYNEDYAAPGVSAPADAPDPLGIR